MAPKTVREATGWGLGVEGSAAEIEDAEAGALGVKPLDDLEKVGGQAC
jgi:hypothetical protein